MIAWLILLLVLIAGSFGVMSWQIIKHNRKEARRGS